MADERLAARAELDEGIQRLRQRKRYSLDNRLVTALP